MIKNRIQHLFSFLYLSVAQLVERGIVVGLSQSFIQYSYGHWFESDRRDFRVPWRNWLARSAVNRKVPGSSPGGTVMVIE